MCIDRGHKRAVSQLSLMTIRQMIELYNDKDYLKNDDHKLFVGYRPPRPSNDSMIKNIK